MRSMTRQGLTMPLADPRRQALVAIACIIAPLLFAFWLRTAIVGLPLVMFFPAIAIASFVAGQVAGVSVLAVSVVAAVITARTPPLDFTLGLTLNGVLFIGGYALAGTVIYLLVTHQASRAARGLRRVGQERALSGALSRWLSRNASAAALMLRSVDDADLERLTGVARQRLLMTARVERLMRNRIASDGADLSGVLTGLCHELVRAAQRTDLRGVISIAPMTLEHEDFIRLCLVFSDLLFLALHEEPSEAEPLQVALRLEGGEIVLTLAWWRADVTSWAANAHRAMTERVASRVARSLGGALHWSAPGAGPAWSALRFPDPGLPRSLRLRRG